MRNLALALLAAVTLVGAGLSTPPTTAAQAAEGAAGTPNVLLITTDDQNIDDLDHMPYTRQLLGADAGNGVTFTDAVSPYPLCCPARATLLTGLFNHNNGVYGNAGRFGGYPALERGEFADETVPTWLGDRYETAFVGKFVNMYGGSRVAGQPVAVPEGWDYFAAGVAGVGLYDYYAGDMNVLDRTLPGNPEPEIVSLAGTNTYRTDFNTEKVHQRIDHAAAAGKPFFIWQSEIAPHGACYTRSDGRTCAWGDPMYKPEDANKFLNLPLASLSDRSFNERVTSDKPDHIAAIRRWKPENVDRGVQLHRARIRSLQAVDRSVRSTVDKLSSMGQLENTLIIFTSDNGYLIGQHRYTGKTVPYEPSLRVPLLMRGPGVPGGISVGGTASLVDIPATIADVTRSQPTISRGANDEIPVPLDGTSLMRLANGARGWSAMPIEAGYEEATAPNTWWYRGVRTRRWVYVEYEQSGEAELYDLLRDPDQLDNVAYRATHAATRAALAQKLQALRGCQGAACRAQNDGGIPLPVSDGTVVHPDELGSIGTATQVVTITAPRWNSPRGTAAAWRKVGRSWRLAMRPFPVSLGARGMVKPHTRRHLLGKTPAGSFTPFSAMGLRPNPGSRVRYRRLDASDYWPYDVAHAATYSVIQPFRSKKARWAEERAVRFAQRPRNYQYAVVMDYNRPTRIVRNTRFKESVARVPARVPLGSFLLHTGSTEAGQGWVTMPPARLARMLRWMDPAQHGTRFVVGTPGYVRSTL